MQCRLKKGVGGGEKGCQNNMAEPVSPLKLLMSPSGYYFSEYGLNSDFSGLTNPNLVGIFIYSLKIYSQLIL